MKNSLFALMTVVLLSSCTVTDIALNHQPSDKVVVINNLDDKFMVNWAGLTVFDTSKENVELGYARSQVVTDYVKSKSNNNVYFDIKDVPKDGSAIYYLHITNGQDCAGYYCSSLSPASGIFGNGFNRLALSTLDFELTDQPTPSGEATTAGMINRYYFKKNRVKASITKKKIKKKADPIVFKGLMQCLDQKTLDLAMHSINQSIPLFHSVAVPEGKQSIKKSEVVVIDKACLAEL